MGKQLIISIGREFGSAGHEIGELLAQKYNIPLLDNTLLAKVSEEKSIDLATLKKYDERPKNKLFSRTVAGHSNSIEDSVAHMQFDYLKKLAGMGQSFVIVGRCAEHVLKEYRDNMVSIFVLGDIPSKCKRIMRLYKLNEDDAKKMMKKQDWARKSYHNYYCKGKWGDSRNYDMCINSSLIGLEGTINVVAQFVKEKTGIE